MAADLTIALTLDIVTEGVVGSGSEKSVVIPKDTRRCEVFAHTEDLTISDTSTGTGAVTTSTTVPAGSGLTIWDGGPLRAAYTLYVLQATAAGTAQFMVTR